MRQVLRFGVAFGLVGLATGFGELVGADITVAAMLYLVAVLLAALLGPWAGAAAAISGYFTFDWFYTPPPHHFDFERGTNITAGLAFLVAAGVIGWVVANLRALRLRERQRSREAQVRLELCNRLVAGEDPESVATAAEAAISDLFGLSDCSVRFDGESHIGDGPPRWMESGGGVRLCAGDVTVEAVESPNRLISEDRGLLEALLASLAGALDRMHLEEETREARIALQVGRTRTGLISAVSHNLRTPLASIRAAATTLRAPDAHLEAADHQELLDIVVDETERLERMVAKTLDLSRIRAGGLEPEPQTVDIGDLATAAARRIAPVVREQLVRVSIAPTIEPIAVDVSMLEEVFLNLLENALRFAQGSEILITAQPVCDDLEVRVIDHGPGVPDTERERIFEEFVRGEARADTQGTGLGLAIVRAHIAAHGGTSWVEETPGGGATFVIRLPNRRTL